MEENRFRLETATRPPGLMLTQLRLPSVESAVQGMVDRALVYCAEQQRLNGPEEALESLRRGDRVTRWFCHDSLGAQAAQVLGDLDNTVKQVLIFHLDAPPEDLIFGYGEPGPTLPIHLVVEVQNKTEDLQNLVGALEQALLKEYARAAGHCKEDRLLEVQVIDADDIKKRRGYTALLGSLLECPVQVWQR
jgi:hypothetical protein